jgi:hypothetical protein
VRINSNYQIDNANHAILVDASTRVGEMVGRVFAALLLRECGEAAFRVERLKSPPQPTVPE